MKLIATLIACVLVAIIVSVYISDNTPPVHLTQQQIAIRDSSEWNAHIRGLLFQWSLLGLFVAACIAAIYRFLYVPAVNARERVPVDETGMYSEVVRDITPLHKRLGGERKIWVHNANMVAAPYVYATLNGKMEIEAATEGATVEQQLAYARSSWAVQRVAASANGLNRPTVAAMKDAAGVYDAEARRKNAQAQLAEYRLPADRQIEVAQQPVITPAQALQRSANGVVCIGQAATNGNALATWDSNAASTLGIFGANGTGKTTTVATMVTLAMLRWGWQLYILDGKDAGDWDEFRNHAQVMQVDRHNIESAIESVWQEYQKRKAIMSQHRARNYQHLPPEVQAGNPPWGIVFEEYGATRLRLRNALRVQLDKFIDVLCKEARYTGWHGVFIDQRPSDYTDDMKGNLKTIVCFKLLMNQGHAVNAYHAGKLANRGEFEMDGARYWAFYAEDMCRSELARMPPKRLTMNGYERSTNGYERQLPEANVHERAGDERTQTLSSVYERTRSWDQVGKKFFELYPDGTQADLRRAMAAIDGREPDAFKGEAYRLYHTYSGA